MKLFISLLTSIAAAIGQVMVFTTAIGWTGYSMVTVAWFLLPGFAWGLLYLLAKGAIANNEESK